MAFINLVYVHLVYNHFNSNKDSLAYDTRKNSLTTATKRSHGVSEILFIIFMLIVSCHDFHGLKLSLSCPFLYRLLFYQRQMSSPFVRRRNRTAATFPKFIPLVIIVIVTPPCSSVAARASRFTREEMPRKTVIDFQKRDD